MFRHFINSYIHICTVVIAEKLTLSATLRLIASRTLQNNSAWDSQDVEWLLTPEILCVRVAVNFENLSSTVRSPLFFSQSLCYLGGGNRWEHQINCQFERVVKHSGDKLAKKGITFL